MTITHFRPPATIRASLTGDGLVLLDVDRGLLFAANAVGARIWQMLEQGGSTGEISARIAAEFDVGSDRAARDVDAFLASLVSRGLLTIAEGVA